MWIFLILVLVGISAGQHTSVFFPAVSHENPAHYAEHLSWQVDLYRPYAGIGDLIYLATLSSQYGLKRDIFSLNISFLNSDKYYRTSVEPGVGMLIGKKLSLGIAPKILFDGWNRDNFHYTELDEPNDLYFRNNENTFGFSAVIGAEYRASRTIVLGFVAENLIPAKMGGSNVSRSTIEPNISLDMRSKMLYGVATFGTAYDFSAPAGKELGLALGYSKRILEPFEVGVSFVYPSLLFDAGLSLKIMTNLFLHYAFEYPVGSVSKVSSSHRFAVSGRWFPPVKKPNFSVRVSASPSKIPSQSQSLITAVVDNKHVDVDIPVQFYLITEAETLLAERIHIKKDESKTFTTQKSFSKTSVVFAVVDALNEVDESSEDDNLSQVTVEVLPPPDVQISISPAVLKVKRVSYTYQDRSVVPTVFFRKNSAEFDRRFDFLVNLIVQRLVANPDVNLEVVGFLAPDEDSSNIARRRAESVRNSLISRSSEIAERLKIVPPDDVRKLRVPQFGLKPGDTILLLDENRRTEIFAKLGMKVDTTVPYGSYPIFDWRLISAVLERNEDVILVVSADNSVGDERQALDEAFKLKEYIVEVIGRKFENRVFASIARMESKANAVHIFLSADGVLYKPFVVGTSKDISPRSIADAEIQMSARGEIVSWQVDAINANTYEFISTIAEGKGAPPQKIRWNFATPDGDIVPLGRKVAVRAIVRDIFDRADTSYTQDTVKTVIEESEMREEKMLLVQFEFDKPSAQSRYLEDRLEIVARRLIEIIKQSKGTTITVEGHTDVIGLKPRNTTLSQERANAILRQIKLAMASIINVSSEELDVWLRQHNSKIMASGFSDANPYEIYVLRDGTLTKVLLGDNSLPEGRTINRRVLVVIWAEK